MQNHDPDLFNGSKQQIQNILQPCKGSIGGSLEKVGFEEFHILRPSLLLGKRTEARPAEHISKLIMDHLSFLIPWKYKPIHASIIAKTIKCIIMEEKSGKYIWEGRKLFNI